MASAVGIGLIDPPVGVFIAAIPFLKMLKGDRMPTPSQFIGQVLEGIAKPLTAVERAVRTTATRAAEVGARAAEAGGRGGQAGPRSPRTA